MIKNIIRNIVLKEKASSRRYVNFLRKKGAQVGENVRFYDPYHTFVDVSAPWLLTIGDHVAITRGVTILTHDYAWSVLRHHRESRGELLGAQSPVTVGNNVFIGMNAVILRGVTVGDDVIIGAGSVVTADCDSGFVYAGNPAKKICSVADFREKRRRAQFAEARKLALHYRKRFGKDPAPEVFREYFHLFCTPEQAIQNPVFRRQIESGGNFEETIAFLRNTSPQFDSYEAFLTACFEEETPC